MSGASGAVVMQIKREAEAASKNEQLTRQRVERLELWVSSFTGMKFLRRLEWLFFGR